MLKKMRTLLLPVCVMLVCICGVFIAKILIGTQIAHYKQFLYPCQGQIIGTHNIEFYFLDEEKLSELADVNNIKDIFIVTDLGEKKKAETWNVSEQEEYYSDKYVSRILSLSIPSEEEFTIEKLTIVYVDIEETFDVGKLKIIPWNVLPSTNIEIESNCKNLELPVDWSSPDFEYDGPTEPFAPETMEPPRFNFIDMAGVMYSVPNSVTITSIDLGITGMGIIPDTIRVLQGESLEPFGDTYAFATKPENEIYLQTDLVEALPEQTFSVKVDQQQFSIYASIRMTQEYETELNCLYISPIYHYIDNETGIETVYGNKMNYNVFRPMLQYEEEAEKILEEKGI